MPYSGNSSHSISVVPPKSSSAWPMRPLGSVSLNFSVAPKTSPYQAIALALSFTQRYAKSS
jgi:hypothetical protein